ncbi:MAG: D-aminoacyl-tRNA deacylase, partial [Terriglobales bacterium]
PEDARYIAEKVRYLRIFADAAGAMNLDITAAGGSVLLVSAFTLLADARKGRRPAFIAAAPLETARGLYETCAAALRGLGRVPHPSRSDGWGRDDRLLSCISLPVDPADER